jgi:hypothetical protein
MALTFTTMALSASYDPFLLQTQLSLLPKIALLEKNLSFTKAKAPMKILIAYDKGDEETALICTKILMGKFHGVLNGHPLQVSTLSFDQLDDSQSYHFIYALKGSLSQLKKVHNTASASDTITALYDADTLGDDGILLSVQMERSPVILINSKAIKNGHFSFPDGLFEMARIVR